jgi:maltose alpha-D-glucosyltransferase/alpha-amylase
MIFELSDGVSSLLENGARNWLQSEILPAYVRNRRWFASKDKTITAVQLQSCCPVQVDDAEILLAEIEVDLGGGREVYQLHLGLCLADGSETALAGQLKLADVTWRGRPALLTDAFALDAFAKLFLDIIDHQRSIRCGDTTVVGVRQTDLPRTQDHPQLRRISAEQSNSSLIVGDGMIMKLIRRVMPGINPEVEMVRYLTEQNYANTPPLLGEIQRYAADGTRYSMVVLQEFIPNQGDGWEFTLGYLTTNPSDFSAYAAFAAAIGQRLGELHAVSALASEDESFAAHEADESMVRTWSDRAGTQISKAVAVLNDLPTLTGQAGQDRDFVLNHLPGLSAVLPQLAKSGIGALLTRIHGDFHLGQVLVAETDAYIIDFEGEPAKPLEIRRAKSSPLRDVAGLLRSLDYAAASADVHQSFVTSMSAEFLKAYRHVARAATRRWVVNDDQESNLLDLFLLEKSAYEICYEASNRPTWLAIPLSGFAGIVRRVLGSPEASDA